MEEEIQDLKNRIRTLEAEISEIRLSYRQILRLKNALRGSVTYYVATGATGAAQTPLKWVDGILTDNS